MSSWRIVTRSLALVVCAFLAWPDHGYGRSRAHTGSQSRGGSHLYVLLGLGNNSPGLSEFGSRIGRRGIPTTVRNYGDWPSLAQEAIQQYQSGRLRSIMIVGHSLGGSAAVDMAAELGRAGVPVQLVVTLDPVGGSSQVSSNVRRSVNFRPTGGEDHFSVIAAHERDMSNYVLGETRSRGARAVIRRRGVTP
jgi:pimeloyl-ACP methyl ester carboxylesterase